MIKEDYCSFETSKMLKEKGFNGDGGDCECHMFYCEYTEERIMPICEIGLVPDNEEVFFAPTHQMAMAWLREEKNIFISICNGNHCKLDKNISSETVYYFFSITNSYGVYKEEEQCFDEFKTYEEAVEAAIKYTLENLI